MESLLQEAAGGRARGWRRWYAVSHAARCVRCGNFLQRLQATLILLRESRNESTDPTVVERLRAKLAEIEGR